MVNTKTAQNTAKVVTHPRTISAMRADAQLKLREELALEDPSYKRVLRLQVLDTELALQAYEASGDLDSPLAISKARAPLLKTLISLSGADEEVTEDHVKEYEEACKELSALGYDWEASGADKLAQKMQLHTHPAYHATRQVGVGKGVGGGVQKKLTWHEVACIGALSARGMPIVEISIMVGRAMRTVSNYVDLIRAGDPTAPRLQGLSKDPPPHDVPHFLASGMPWLLAKHEKDPRWPHPTKDLAPLLQVTK